MRDAIVIAIFVGAYVLIATEWIHRVVVALTGAALMLAIRAVSGVEAFHSEQFGVDWNVVFLLLGMMIIVGVIRRTGLFEYLAIWAAKRARGRPFRVFVFMISITAVASALLDNVTTILLVAPVTVLIAERLGAPVAPYLMAEVMASNIGGTATLIGDPPNILIGSRAGLSYLDFLWNLGPLVLILMVVFVVMSRWLFHDALVAHPDRVEELMALDETEALTGGPLLPRSLAVLGLVTLGFALQEVIHYEPSVVALLGAGTLLLVGKEESESYLRDVEWGTLLFFLGLFVMVGALAKAGVTEYIGNRFAQATEGDLLLAVILLVIISGVLSAVIDNIPYVATMTPVVAQLAKGFPAGEATVLWWALAIGADLGGNATSIGASANVVVLGVAERSGQKIRFIDFFRRGWIVAAVTMGVSVLYLWVRYFVL